MEKLMRRPLFNPAGDTEVRLRKMVGGNTTNLNDFNNMKYTWVSGWYRQAMNNFWVPEEINLGVDVKDYPLLTEAERRAYDKILSFLVFLDSIQTANLPSVSEYITANEVNLCLLSRPSRRRCTARATAICWIQYASPRKGRRCSTSGRRTSICWSGIRLSEISIISSRKKKVFRSKIGRAHV